MNTTETRHRFFALSDKWRVTIDRVIDTPSATIGFARRGKTPVVLKVVRQGHEEWDAGGLVARFDGHGMVRVLEYVPGAALLEEARPGTQLVEWVRAGRDREATDALIGVVRAMERGRPDPSDCPTAETWGRSFEAYLEDGGTAIARKLVSSARERYLELCGSQREVRLLHGDLQHYNVLLDAERGWLAVDPKGVVAETEFELGAALRNPDGMPELFTEAAMERRIAQFAAGLGVDAGRVAGWAFSQAVLSAIWMIEDGEDPSRLTSTVEMARGARGLGRRAE